MLRLLDKSRSLLPARRARHARRHARRVLASSCARRSAWCCAPARPAAARPRRSTRRSPRSTAADRNIMTIEDPVEYVFPIDQPDPDQRAGRHHVRRRSASRSCARTPTSILVGEIRDVETARIAVQSALTGHFVLSSLHATDAAAALHRLLDMGIESFLVASSVLAVVGQRLVRRICDDCTSRRTSRPRRSWRSTSIGGADRRTRSCTARAATSAPTPATRTASACTSCCASPTR